MKTLGLSLLLCCLSAAAQTQTASDAPAKNQASAQVSQSAADNFISKVDQARLRSGDSNLSYCAYMRTYRVKREYRGSDVVRPAGYTKCVPAERFELRTSVLVQSESDSSK